MAYFISPCYHVYLTFRLNSSLAESVLEELALYFLLSCFLLGFVNDSVAKSIVALRLTLVVKASTCVPGDSHSNDLECSGKGKCATKPSEVRVTWELLHITITKQICICIYV